MNNIISEIIRTYPRHSVVKIKRNADLWNWVLDHCDVKSTNDAVKIYTAITGQRQICDCGSQKPRMLKSLKEGFRFCGTAGRCSSARQSISQNCVKAAKLWNKEEAKEKRSRTNLEKYGVANAGRTIQAQKGHEAFYKDKEKVSLTISKMQNTCLINYGVTNPLKSDVIKQKVIATNLDRYGVDNPQKIKNLKRTKPNTENFLKYSFNRIKNKLSILGYTILCEPTDYIGVNQAATAKYKFKHDCGFEFETYIYSGHVPLCPACFSTEIKNSSNAEKEIQNWIRSIYNGTVLNNNKSIINPWELDIVLPEKNLAIEYCGLYWHSEHSNSKSKNYHKNKQDLCKDKGFDLITIFEDEWLTNKNICQNIILNKLNQKTKTIAARKCSIVDLSSKQVKDFLQKNHLQGYSHSKVNLALQFENEIVQVMTFNKPRYNQNVDWELIRLCSKVGLQVIGGTEKLWAYFQKTHRPESVVSYCDRRWFTGKVYEKLGFTRSKISEPTYWYTDYKQRFHRSKFTKKNCVKILQERDVTVDFNKLTEKYLTLELIQLDRIWDCGQDTWIYHK